MLRTKERAKHSERYCLTKIINVVPNAIRCKQIFLLLPAFIALQITIYVDVDQGFYFFQRIFSLE
jgi:hypothetical protein